LFICHSNEDIGKRPGFCGMEICDAPAGSSNYSGILYRPAKE
jgi:hypothetical protein